MRAAVLVLASHTPRALHVLASYFAPSDVDMFVHVDAKTNLADYLAQTASYPPRVRFLETRRRVYWSGFSMVEATLDLLRAAVSAGPYDRYVFISDNSLPVHSLDGFYAQLAAREDILECMPLTTRHAQACYDEFYLTDDDLFDARRVGLRPRPVDPALEDQISRMIALKARGKKPAALYNGQASWALGPDAVRLVLAAADNDDWWAESCRFGVFSDEFFFATLVAAKYPDGLADSPTYTDTLRFAPRVIRRSQDLPFDMHPHFLFLRKIAPDFAPDLPETCLRLYGGVRRMLADDPGLRDECVVGVSEGGVPHLYLFAPSGDDPAWGAQGNYRGRRFRKLTTASTSWRLRSPMAGRTVRVTLPCVDHGDDAVLAGAALEFAGQRVSLAPCDIGFNAKFSALARPIDAITLHLPGGDATLGLACLPEA